MMRSRGFTLIEVLAFLVVTSLFLTVMLLGVNTASRKTPAAHQQWVALQTARGCMEWFLEQRRLKGYSVLTCPSTPSTSACPALSGYSISASVSCTTWNSDAAYKTVTINVTGLSAATLSMMVGDA